MFLWDLQNQISPDFSSLFHTGNREGTSIPQYQANIQPGSMYEYTTRKYVWIYNQEVTYEYTTRTYEWIYNQEVMYVLYVGCHGFPTLALSFLMSLKCSSKKATKDVEGGFYFWLCVFIPHRQVRALFCTSCIRFAPFCESFNCNLALLQWTRSDGLRNQTTQQRLKKEQTLHWSGTTTWRVPRFAV